MKESTLRLLGDLLSGHHGKPELQDGKCTRLERDMSTFLLRVAEDKIARQLLHNYEDISFITTTPIYKWSQFLFSSFINKGHVTFFIFILSIYSYVPCCGKSTKRVPVLTYVKAAINVLSLNLSRLRSLSQIQTKKMAYQDPEGPQSVKSSVLKIENVNTQLYL